MVFGQCRDITSVLAVAEDRGHPRHGQPVRHRDYAMMQTRLILEATPRQKDSIVVAEFWQDVEPILERNKMLRSMPQPPRRREDWADTSQRSRTWSWCDGSTKNTRAAARTWRCSARNSTK